MYEKKGSLLYGVCKRKTTLGNFWGSVFFLSITRNRCLVVSSVVYTWTTADSSQAINADDVINEDVGYSHLGTLW